MNKLTFSFVGESGIIFDFLDSNNTYLAPFVLDYMTGQFSIDPYEGCPNLLVEMIKNALSDEPTLKVRPLVNAIAVKSASYKDSQLLTCEQNQDYEYDRCFGRLLAMLRYVYTHINLTYDANTLQTYLTSGDYFENVWNWFYDILIDYIGVSQQQVSSLRDYTDKLFKDGIYIAF